jgi:hypothetical protein
MGPTQRADLRIDPGETQGSIEVFGTPREGAPLVPDRPCERDTWKHCVEHCLVPMFVPSMSQPHVQVTVHR